MTVGGGAHAHGRARGSLASFRHGSALALPFDDASFDVVWTEHAQMNVADKPAFYREIARVLRPGGRLAFNDVFQGPRALRTSPSRRRRSGMSFLAAPHDVRGALPHLGLRVLEWEDTSLRAAGGSPVSSPACIASGPSLVGAHLLMGSTARTKIEHMHKNFEEQRIVVVQATAERTWTAYRRAHGHLRALEQDPARRSRRPSDLDRGARATGSSAATAAGAG